MKPTATLFSICCAAFAALADVTVETSDFRMTIGDDASVKSLVVKATGEECIEGGCKKPFLSVTQDRPFDNELKLIHPNKRIVYPATSLRKEGTHSSSASTTGCTRQRSA